VGLLKRLDYTTPSHRRTRPPNGLEMSRPASQGLVSRRKQPLAGRVGSIELLGGQRGFIGEERESPYGEVVDLGLGFEPKGYHAGGKRVAEERR